MFGGGFDSNSNIGDVPEIELPICDLITLIINTDVDNFMPSNAMRLNYDMFDP